MILKAFPDLTWIKKQAASHFEGQVSAEGHKLPHKGWPSVILNASCQRIYRPNIRGPISLFMNLKGVSRCGVNGRMVSIDENFFFLTNQHEYYTLEVESEKNVELFNIHFGEFFAQNLYASLVTEADNLLENVPLKNERPIAFHTQLYERDPHFNRLIYELYLSHQQQFESLQFEEQLADILIYLLMQHRKELTKAMRLPLAKQSTKIEMYKRLSLVVDYIYTYFNRPLSLEELAHIGCLSKHHFLRLFKIAYGLTPHQFIVSVRIKRACELLRDKSLSIQDVALCLGFEYANSFSRLFKKKIGVYPNAYRNAL